MMEIRSYRRVFDLERRVYSIDSLRLNPTGVPVRGVLYFVALLVAGLLAARLPLAGRAVDLAPWYVRYIVLPGAAATVLGMIRLEGRTFHLAALALARLWLGRRRLACVRPCSGPGERWYPPDILFLPDGSEAGMRSMRYTGPGAVLVAVEHERSDGGSRSALTLDQCRDGRALEKSQVILLATGARMRVRSARRRRRGWR